MVIVIYSVLVCEINETILYKVFSLASKAYFSFSLSWVHIGCKLNVLLQDIAAGSSLHIRMRRKLIMAESAVYFQEYCVILKEF